MKIPIEQIIVSKDNPRQNFDEEGLRRLGKSIKSHGQLQPIVVRHRGQGFLRKTKVDLTFENEILDI